MRFLLIALFLIMFSSTTSIACTGGPKHCDEGVEDCWLPACVEDPEPKAQSNFKVEGAYSYPTSLSQRNGAAFMMLQNSGEKDLRVVGASSDVAEKVELHTHVMDEGVMMMREVDYYEVKAGGETVLEPSGHHIMLMGLKKQLVEGESFDVRLKTEDEQFYDVTVTIGVP